MGWGLLLAGLLAGTTVAADKEPGTSQIEASMLVSGTLSVDATGATTGFTLDKRGKLPPPVMQLLDQMLPTFRFKPVEHDGQPVAVATKMSLQVVANQIDPGHISLRLRSARFVEADPPKTERISIHRRTGINYPGEAWRDGVGGTVYLALRIDHAGNVADIEAQQVNLKKIGTDSQMQHWREVLANNAIEAARRFTFNVPTTGKNVHDAFFTGTLPVIYVYADGGVPDYGRWDSYVPGPRRDVAWLHDEDDRDANNTEAVPNGEFAMTGDSLQLLTPLGG